MRSTAWTDVVAAGRRSGKDEVFTKRRGVLRALADFRHTDGRSCFCAPTQDQAKDIFWDDLKAMVPPARVRHVQESYPQTITLDHGYRLEVRGLDKPQRIEGKPVDEVLVTETDDLKSIAVFDDHVLPALGTIGRPGRLTAVGVPNGKTILWELRKRALENPDWAYYEWRSDEVMTADEIERFRRVLDPDSFEREFNASFANFEGRAYYPFDWALHAIERLQYDPALPLVFAFDFNVAPGVAVVLQEQVYRGPRTDVVDPRVTAVLGEVWIQDNSNTEMVCRRLIQDWGGHAGPVTCYGDPSGGERRTSGVRGSDWDLIAGSEGVLRRHFGPRLRVRVAADHPPVRARVNAVNRRLLTAAGRVRMLVDPARAPHVCEDLDGVLLVKGGAFEIDKKRCEAAGLTHLSDALGYYLHEEVPVREVGTPTTRPIR